MLFKFYDHNYCTKYVFNIYDILFSYGREERWRGETPQLEKYIKIHGYSLKS